MRRPCGLCGVTLPVGVVPGGARVCAACTPAGVSLTPLPRPTGRPPAPGSLMVRARELGCTRQALYQRRYRGRPESVVLETALGVHLCGVCHVPGHDRLGCPLRVALPEPG